MLGALLLAACSSGPTERRSTQAAGRNPPPTLSPSSSSRPATPACRSTALHQRQFGIRVGGVRRTYLLSAASGAGPRPLVILFHGYDETARWIDRYTQLPRAGVAAGFVVATPSGYDERWNFPRRRSVGPDDVAFIRQMVKAVATTVCLNTSAIFVTGFSDGADMADTVACVDPVVRAVAGVAASVPVRHCSHHLDVLQIHGDADPVVPYQGGGDDRPPPFQGEDAVSVTDQMRAWRHINGCGAMGCSSGRQVTLIDVRGGGHTWPGASIDLPYGATSHALSATQRILYFFEQFLGG